MSTPENPPPAGGDEPGRGLSGVQRAGIVLGGLAVLLIVFVVLRGGDESGRESSPPSAPSTASQNTASQSTASQSTAPQSTPASSSTGETETADDSGSEAGSKRIATTSRKQKMGP